MATEKLHTITEHAFSGSTVLGSSEKYPLNSSQLSSAERQRKVLRAGAGWWCAQFGGVLVR